ncbi:pyridoxal phosphate-dependent decarboxylase family protein [Moorena bouillonii]|uniref:Glutamate decarboxylase n=1 Tax=Moorena bouillonii PNG TaxID=568701 RepID=A0A1U7N6A5_9CYAN|nr:aspartate aminotransferase family protein [Moorena bouillonii]OLT61478.1 glutamate decarboxylase [Moorena bouillonii PNG]
MIEFEKIINLTVDKLLNYLQENQNTDTKVIDYKSPQTLKEKLDLSLPENGVPLADLIPIIESYLDHSVRTSSHKFFNQLWGGFEITGLLAEMVTSTANTSMYTYEVAPVATLIEIKLIEALKDLIGFPQGEGLMVTGGSNANLVAMLCARHKLLPESKNKGLGNHQLVAFISDQAHYSFFKAANLLGMGIDNVVKVKSDGDQRMCPQQLDVAIQQSLSEGKTPFFVTATAGTTVAGAFDPLPSIAEITNKYGLWLHVDGSWGAPVLFSNHHKHLLQGSSLADSFTWDAHKLMGVPLICSAILVKQPGTLLEACSSQGTHYIFHDDEDSAYNLGTMSLQCGRKVDALKLWLAWKYYGQNGYEARVDRLFELASYAADYIRNGENLELIVQPTFLNICFRYNPRDNSLSNHGLDQLNLEIREQLMRSGQALVNYSHYQEQIVIRLILTNPDINEADLDSFFANFIQIGNSLL